MEGLVTRAVSGFFTVQLDAPLPDGQGTLTCKLRGKLKKERQKSELAVAGDRVRVEATSETEGVIDEVLARRSWIVRREPGPRGKHFDDLIVANVDVLVICGAASEPPVQPGLVDRFLVAAELGHVQGLLAITKCDELHAGTPQADALAALTASYRRIGVPVIETSARTGQGLDALSEALSGKIAAFMGKSGAGKSSLLNALAPSLGLAVGEISDASKKGLHTTRVASLHRFADGWLVDTPGLRELALPELDPASLTSLFPELAALGLCQFTDCRHTREPGCVVRAAIEGGAVARGELSESRLESFRKLLAHET